MARRFDCPIAGYEDFFIALPDRWLGKHLMAYQEAYRAIDARVKQMEEAGTPLSQVFMDHYMDVALLEDWKLPGVNGKLEAMNFADLDIEVCRWVNIVTRPNFDAAFVVKKSWLTPLLNGQATPETMKVLDGILEPTP